MPASNNLLSMPVAPDWRAFRDCILRRPRNPGARVHAIELVLDPEVQNAVWDRFALTTPEPPDSPFHALARHARVQEFLGYDYVRASLIGMDWPLRREETEDSADELTRTGGRSFVNEHQGPITNWEEFEAYPWPDPDKADTAWLEWLSEHLPEGMCIVGGGGFGHFAEYLSWLMGYETLCFALYDDRDLVRAISDRLLGIYERITERLLDFERVKMVWGSDDMGFRSGTLIHPDDLREFVLPGHRRMAEISHRAGRPYLLHSCGNLKEIMDDLIDDVGIDAKHSFEDTIHDLGQEMRLYGDRIAILGGIDVDFLCRATPEQVRDRVRRTLDLLMPGGGYCLGTGNSVANYIPLENYLTMLDEGRRYG
jgi:uroporphyrinogen decarboxylase